MLTDLTFIIPTYNRPDYTKRAIRSIIDDNFVFSEIIIIDDGSDEPVDASWFDHDKRIRILRHEKNQGAGAARNTGIKACKTAWASFLDSDDILIPGEFKKRAACIDPQRENLIYGCAWNNVDEKTGELIDTSWPKPAKSLDDHFAGIWFSPGSCVIINIKLAVSKAGLINPNLARLEDYEWFYRLALSGFIFMPQHFVGATISRHRTTRPQLVVEACSKILIEADRLSLLQKQKRYMRGYLHYEKAASFFFSKRYIKCVFYLALSCALKPRFHFHPLPNLVKTRAEK